MSTWNEIAEWTSQVEEYKAGSIRRHDGMLFFAAFDVPGDAQPAIDTRWDFLVRVPLITRESQYYEGEAVDSDAWTGFRWRVNLNGEPYAISLVQYDTAKQALDELHQYHYSYVVCKEYEAETS